MREDEQRFFLSTQLSLPNSPYSYFPQYDEVQLFHIIHEEQLHVVCGATAATVNPLLPEVADHAESRRNPAIRATFPIFLSSLSQKLTSLSTITV